MTQSSYPHPPFDEEGQSFPGKTYDMHVKPDHGESSYQGSGQLKGKKALITGGDSGIGAAVAIAYAREGADLALNFLPGEQRDAERIAEIAREAGAKVALLPGDVSDDAFAPQLIERALAELGGLDVLVNNAAYQAFFDDFEQITLDEWRKTFETNVHAAFNLTRLAVPHLKAGASIINTSSVNAKNPVPNLLPYSTTKGALSNLTVGLAQLLASRHIRVNAVLPGPIWTPFITTGVDADTRASFGSETPFKRPGQPAELASAYVMLASDASSYTSGALITVAGGMPIL